MEAGTVVYGTRRGDGTGSIIRSAGFRPSRHLPDHNVYGPAYWYLPSTRRRPAKQDMVDRCAAALRDAGHRVEVDVDDVTLPTTAFADLEQQRYDRADDRTERFDRYAQGAAAKGVALVEQVDDERSRIPLGQPHLAGHHSYNRTVRAQEERNAKEERGMEQLRRGRRWAGRAGAAARYQAGREELGTTLRRIERLEAEVRGMQRYLAGTIHVWEIVVTSDWSDDYGKTLERRLAAHAGARVVSRREHANTAEVFIPPGEHSRLVTQAQITLLTEEIGYWKTHVAQLQQHSGVRVWARGDFRKGDFVQSGKRWYEVVRVNPKTLTVATGANTVDLKVITRANTRNALGGPGWTSKLPYYSATGQMTAAQARRRFPDAFPPPDPGPPSAHRDNAHGRGGDAR
ncbi:MAG TPA: DUF3560 domain-containing protein [Streptosporangiaceae bacterium]|nr:DUF3560 domain-containing protein [Streptosporangiaceae bacterium]